MNPYHLKQFRASKLRIHEHGMHPEWRLASLSAISWPCRRTEIRFDITAFFPFDRFAPSCHSKAVLTEAVSSMKKIPSSILALLALLALAAPTKAVAQSATEPREFDYFQPYEISHPLLLPGYYSLSKFGRGLYRIDSLEYSRGPLNCIFLTFTAEPPQGIPPGPAIDWKTSKAEVNGAEVTTLTTVLANPFPREDGAEGDVLTVRIDALNEEIAAKLRSIADGFLPE